MTTFASVLLALGFIVALIGAFARLLRRFGASLTGNGGSVPVQVVQRVAVGPRQGVAILRVGDRVIAVSVGDGGVRPLLELDGAARESVLAPAAAAARAAGRDRSDGRLSHIDFFTALGAAARRALPVLLVAACASLISPGIAAAQEDAAAGPGIERVEPRLELMVGDDASGIRLSGAIGVVVMLGLLTLLPTMLLLMTSFTRVLIVLHLLRQALGTQSAPPAHLMAALALLLMVFIMAPTLTEVNDRALQPWLDGDLEQGEMLTEASAPIRAFMLDHTRERDLAAFLEMSRTEPVAAPDDVPLVVLVAAFVTSELRTAFQIGFALFLPFIVIDLVVAAVLMSMGMFMLPPAMVSLPFKLLLFVLVDGWSLIVQGLVTSFR